MKFNKFIKTFLLIVFSAIICLTAVACGNAPEASKTTNKVLSGTFNYKEEIGADKSLKMTDELVKAREHNKKYLVTSFYPMRGHAVNDDQAICYTVTQRLKLKRDYTYEYDVSILLSSPNDWGGQTAEINVLMYGDFTYVEDTNEDRIYTVSISNPTAGTQSITGFDVTGSHINNYAKHGSPDMVIDLGYLATLPNYSFDKYTTGRTVIVNKNKGVENNLTDDMFFFDVLDYVAPYCGY